MPVTLRGVIACTSNQAHRRGVARGGEYFAITLNADGSRSLRSHCVISAPPMVERDVKRFTSVAERKCTERTGFWGVEWVTGMAFAGNAQAQGVAQLCEHGLLPAQKDSVVAPGGNDRPVGQR